MSKIMFDDKSYIEVSKPIADDSKIILTIVAKDQANPLKRVVNTVEITTEQFKQLVADVL